MKIQEEARSYLKDITVASATGGGLSLMAGWGWYAIGFALVVGIITWAWHRRHNRIAKQVEDYRADSDWGRLYG